MNFKIEAIHRPGAHHQAPNATSCLRKAPFGEEEDSEVDIDDEILAYCILAQVSDVESVLQEMRQAPLVAATTRRLKNAQEINAFCQ